MHKMSLLLVVLSVCALHAADEKEKAEALPMEQINKRELSRQFNMILQTGTLEEFTPKLYPVFKTELDADYLELYCNDCECHLNAIEYLERMHADPLLEIVIAAIRSSSDRRAVRNYFERRKALPYTNSDIKNDVLKTFDMIDSVLIGDVTGHSIKTILGILPTLDTVKKAEYLHCEREKAEAIKVVIQEILDTEFQPKRTLLLLGDNLYQFVRLRKQKERDFYA
jgi:hypothetical protein